MKNVKIIFFGNTKYSVLGLKIIHRKFPVSLVVTIPDRPSGRKRDLKPSPVKQFAKKLNIPILETGELNQSELKQISKSKPDFLIVEDYGLILPEALLEIPKYAPLNIHHSLLPKYRGPAPVPTTILNGDEVSGVTIIEMTKNVDAGDILAQKKYKLKNEETTDSLLSTLNKLGGELILKVIEGYKNGRENATKQDDKQASITKRLTKQDGYIDLNKPPDPQTLNRMIRAYFPWPTAWTEIAIGNKRQDIRKIKIKLLPASILSSTSPADPFVIQPESKRPMTIKEFLNGYPETKIYIEKLIKQ